MADLTQDRTWESILKICVSLILLLALHGAWAAPHRPRSDGEVLQLLPVRALPDARRAALQEARSAWRAAPLAVERVDHLARLYISETRSSSDPRYLGYALALLEPWKGKAVVPPAIRLLRASIWQFNHQFQLALTELDQLLKQYPAQAEALLMRASILMVQGQLAAARSSCAALYQGSTLLVGMVCSAQVDGLNGKASAAYSTIGRLLAVPGNGVDGALREWMLLSRIDLAQRLGRKAEVESAFHSLLAAGLPSTETRAAWADWLLSQRRYAELLRFAAGDVRDDGLLLRVALAEQALRLPQAAGHINLLRDRFAAARLRGDQVHQREEARFELELMQQAQRALQLALANWQVQREPTDARLLLEAAVAAGNPAAAHTVLQWMRSTGIEDIALHQAAARLGAGS